MPITQSVDVDAPIELVWKWGTDPERLKQWIPELVSDEVIEEKPGHVGTRFKQVWLERGREMEMEGVVRQWDENRFISIDLECSLFAMTLENTFEQVGGKVRMTQTSDVQYKGCFKLVGLLTGWLMNKKMKEQVSEQFTRLKQLCEAEARGETSTAPSATPPADEADA